MSKAKVKITVKPRKQGGPGTIVARVPIAIEKNDNPDGRMMYETRAKALIDIRTTRNGKPRIRHR